MHLPHLSEEEKKEVSNHAYWHIIGWELEIVKGAAVLVLASFDQHIVSIGVSGGMLLVAILVRRGGKIRIPFVHRKTAAQTPDQQ